MLGLASMTPILDEESSPMIQAQMAKMAEAVQEEKGGKRSPIICLADQSPPIPSLSVEEGRVVGHMAVVAVDIAVGVVGMAVRALRIPRPHRCSPNPLQTSGVESSRSSESHNQILYERYFWVLLVFNLFFKNFLTNYISIIFFLNKTFFFFVHSFIYNVVSGRVLYLWWAPVGVAHFLQLN